MSHAAELPPVLRIFNPRKRELLEAMSPEELTTAGRHFRRQAESAERAGRADWLLAALVLVFDVDDELARREGDPA
jgi:hypothetical protein